MEAFAWFENTLFSTWVRESPLVFPTILILHALGMGCVVGVNVMFGLRLLGVVRGFSPALVRRFVPFLWAGFAASLISGVLLLAGYPAKALTNPVFYLKFAFIGAGFAMWRSLRRRVAIAGEPDLAASTLRRSAVALLLFWASAICAGRLLAYTHHVLLASHLI